MAADNLDERDWHAEYLAAGKPAQLSADASELKWGNEPAAGKSETAKSLQDTGAFDRLATRKSLDDEDQREKSRRSSAPTWAEKGWGGGLGQLDEAGVKQAIADERAAAERSISIWEKVNRAVKSTLNPDRQIDLPDRGRAVETDYTTPQGELAGAPEVTDARWDQWLDRKTASNLAEAKHRLALAADMESGKIDGPRYNQLRARIDDVSRGVSDIVSNVFKGAGYAQAGVTLNNISEGQKTTLYAIGAYLDEKAKAAFPADPARAEEFSTQLGEGAGSMIGFFGPALGARVIAKMSNAGLKTMNAVTVGTSGGSGALAQAGSMVDDGMEGFRKMAGLPKDGPLTPDQERQLNLVFVASLGIGATEAAPIASLFMGHKGRIARRVLAQMVEEGGQEYVQQILENLTAQNAYDPDRKWDDNAWTGAAIGGILGAKMQLGSEGYNKLRGRDHEGQPVAKPGTEPAAPALPGDTRAAAPMLDGPGQPLKPGEGRIRSEPSKTAVEPDLQGFAELFKSVSGPETVADPLNSRATAAPAPLASEAPAAAGQEVVSNSPVLPTTESVAAAPVRWMKLPEDKVMAAHEEAFGEPADDLAEAVRNLRKLPQGKQAALSGLSANIPAQSAESATSTEKPGPTPGEDPAVVRENRTLEPKVETAAKTIGRAIGGDATSQEAVKSAIQEVAKEAAPVADVIGKAIQGDVAAQEQVRQAVESVAQEIAAPAENAAVDPIETLRTAFADVLAGKAPRAGWAKAIGADEAQLGKLIEEAVADGRLEMRNGSPRRNPKAKAAAVRPDAIATPAAPPPAPAAGPVLSRSEEKRLEKMGPVAYKHANELFLARGDEAAYAKAIEGLKKDKKATKSVLDEIHRAIVGTKPPKTKPLTIAAIAARGQDANSAGPGKGTGTLPEGRIPDAVQPNEGGRDTAGSPGNDGPGSGRDVAGSGSADAQQSGPADGVRPASEGTGSDTGAGARDGVSRPDPRSATSEVITANTNARIQAEYKRIAAELEQKRQDRVDRNYRISDADKIGEGGPKVKVRGNLEALRVLKEIEETGRTPTDEDKKSLVKYVGWGAFAQDVFATHKAEWAKEREQLQNLMTVDEYKSARASTINAHYTSPDVIKGMWTALERLGFKGGRALEPSAGVGHFIGMQPESMRGDTAWTAVELDTLSGRITKALYGAADVRIGGFENQVWPDNHFDLAISNVPFDATGPVDPAYKTKFSLHDYFFVKALDKVRPGGIVAFITSSYSMDKTRDAARREMEKRGTFLGAIRLPGGSKGAFKANAGTDVTTDIIFFRKRIAGEPADLNPEWMTLAEIKTPEGPTQINGYFAKNPDQMLGKMRLIGSMYSKGEPVLIGPATDLDQKIAKAAEAMPANSMLDANMTAAEIEPEVDTEAGDVKEGAFYEKDGKIYRKIVGVGVPQKLNSTDAGRVRSFMGIRDVVNEMLRKQARGDRQGMDDLRNALTAEYDSFVANFGPINTVITKEITRKDGKVIVQKRYPNLSAFDEDVDAAKVSAIELYDDKTGKATKSAIFKEDIVAPYERPEITGPADALAVSLNEKGKVDIKQIAESLKTTERDAIAMLGDEIYLNPVGEQWQTAAQYLSGDVVTKLEVVKAAAALDRMSDKIDAMEARLNGEKPAKPSETKYDRNIKALEAVQPEPLTRLEITVPLGATWVPLDVYNDFLREALGASGMKVTLNDVTKEWKVYGRPNSQAAIDQWGTDRRSVAEIVEAAINSKPIVIMDKQYDGSSVRNPAAEEQARAKAIMVREAFAGQVIPGAPAAIGGWVWQNEARAQMLEGLYNKGFNRIVQEKHDGSHLTFPGLAKTVSFPDGSTGSINLTPARVNAVWRVIQNGNTLIDHVVGAGKTWTSIMAVQEMKRLGQIRRPMFVVPNHMLHQFSHEFLQAYPNAKLLVADKKSMSKEKRREFAAKAASDRWDGIIITHSAFGRLKMQQSAYKDYYEEIIEQMETAKRGEDDATVKDIEKARKRIKVKLEKLTKESAKDEGVTFEELGVDHLTVDEAHCFPHDTLIATNKGMLKIGDIVARKMPVKVMSFDHESGRVIWQRVSQFWRHDRNDKQFVRISTQETDILCTTNHQVFVEGRGYVRADSVKPGEAMRALRSDVRSEVARENGSSTTALFAAMRQDCRAQGGDERLRALPPTVHVQEFGRDEQFEARILLQSMRSAVAHVAAGTSGEVGAEDARSNTREMGDGSRVPETHVFAVSRANARGKSYAVRRNSCSGQSAPQWQNVSSAWGQWLNHEAAGDVACLDGLADGARHSDRARGRSIPQPAALFQGGLSRSGTHVGYRSGWQDASHAQMEVSRRSENSGAPCARVVSVEVLERGSAGEPRRDRPEDQYVYDIGIEGEHNYFAGGLLVHNSFKNLWFMTRHTRVKGISNSSESQRATDLYIKIRALEKTRPGRSALFLTGTPLSNTMAEVHTMMRYLQHDTLKEYGIGEFDSWAQTFGVIDTATELAPNGRDFRDTSSFSKFINIPELSSLYARIADTQTAESMKLPRPKLKGGKPQIVEANLSAGEEAFVQNLIQKMEQLKGAKPEKGKENFLSLFTQGLQVGTDFRLIDPSAPFNPDGKLSKAVDNVFRHWEEGNADPKAPNQAQLIFLDMGVPGSKAKATVSGSLDVAGPAEGTAEADIERIRRKLAEEQDEEAGDDAEAEPEVNEDDAVAEAMLAGKFNLYADIKERLIEKGLPADQIAFIHDAKNDEQKARVFEAVRSGKVRVLIGSSKKMGVGTNVQKLLVAMHHIDAPWRPADVEQRDGRILRQGNKNEEVSIYRYITKKSFDAYRWQILEKKSHFIGQFRAGARGVRIAEDIDSPLPEAAELKAAATGDPRIVEHAELSRQVRVLEAQKSAHLGGAVRARTSLQEIKARLERTKTYLAAYEADAKLVTDISGDNFAMKLDVTKGGEKDYTERKKAGEAIRTYLLALAERSYYSSNTEFDIGTVSGLGIAGKISRSTDGIVVRPKLVGQAEYNGADGFILNDKTDPVGLAQKWARLVGAVPQSLEAAQKAVANYTADIPRLEETAAGSPFAKDEELLASRKRLAELTQSLKPQEKPAPVEQSAPAEPTDEPQAATAAETRVARAQAQQALVSRLAEGRRVRIGQDVVNGFMEAARPHLDVLPSYARLGVIESIEPLLEDRPGLYAPDVVATFREPDGSTFRSELRLDDIIDNRALFDRRTNAVLMLGTSRTELVGNLGAIVGSGIRHEVVHAIWKNLAAGVRSRLVAHANSLQILDMQLGTVLRAIGHDSTFFGSKANLTLREVYTESVGHLPDFQDRLDQEAVAHMRELEAVGFFFPQEMAAVQGLIPERGETADTLQGAMPFAAAGSGLVEEDPRKAEYVKQAMRNLSATSRTAKGVVDTSASAGKAAQMAAGLDGDKAKTLALANFERVIGEIIDTADSFPTDPDQVGALIDQIAIDVNAGILKEDALYRQDDSTKYPYTAATEIEQAHAQFAEELALRLSDLSADPVETAAWIEWRANLTDHFWADGVGKTSKALAAIPLIRAGMPLPAYRSNKEFFDNASRVKYSPFNGGEGYLDDAWAKFLAYYRTLMPAVEQTVEYPGYGTAGFEAARKFNINGAEVTGYPAAMDYLRSKFAASAGPEGPAVERKATIILGPPGAGKSTLSRPLARLTRSTVIDGDVAKFILPEFARGAAAVHEEASTLAKRVQADVIKSGENVIIEKLGNSPDSILTIVRALKNQGYDVSVASIEAPRDVLEQRIAKRAKETGRDVPVHALEAALAGIGNTLTVVENSGLVRGVMRLDTGGAKPHITYGSQLFGADLEKALQEPSREPAVVRGSGRQDRPGNDQEPGSLEVSGQGQAEAEEVSGGLPADTAAQIRILRVANPIARSYARDLRAVAFDKAAFDTTLESIANDGRLNSAAVASIAEAYTGLGGHTSRSGALSAIRREFAARGHDMALAELSGFDAQLSGSNLAVDDAIRARLGEMGKRLPESIGLHIAPMIQVSLARSQGQVDAALAGTSSIKEKIANIEALQEHIHNLPDERRIGLNDQLDVVITRGVGNLRYDLVEKGKKYADRNGNIQSVGTFVVKPAQRMDATGVEVTNARIEKRYQRQGIGSLVYDMVDRDMAAFGGVVPSPRDQLSPLAEAFWAKRLGSDAMFSIRGYHRSRANFDKFSTLMQGTGYGGQAKGDGLYISNSQARTQSLIEDGHDYEVDINVDDSLLLDWDKPIAEQGPEVREAFKNVDQSLIGSEAYRDVFPFQMKKAGVRGIKYAVEDAPALADGTPTLDYVVFNDEDVDIVAKDGKPVTKAQRDAVLASIRQKRAVRAELEGGVFSPELAAATFGIDSRPYKKILAVSLAYGPEAAMRTFTHEEIHALRAVGLFDDAEWKVLEGATKRKPKVSEAQRILDMMLKNEALGSGVQGASRHEELLKRAGQLTYREIYDIDRRYAGVSKDMVEETVAHIAADWSDGNAYGTRVERILNKVSEFMERLKNLFSGNGFRSVDSVFQSVWSGEIAKKAGSTTSTASGDQGAITLPSESRFNLKPSKRAEDRFVSDATGYVDYTVETNGDVDIARLGVKDGLRRQGNGRKLMNELLAEADRVGANVTLKAKQLGDVPVADLVTFYKSLGFTIVDGSEREPLMVRVPSLPSEGVEASLAGTRDGVPPIDPSRISLKKRNVALEQFKNELPLFIANAKDFSIRDARRWKIDSREYEPGTKAHYDIVLDGKVFGDVALTVNGDEAYIDWIGSDNLSSGGKYADAASLGVPALRKMREQFRKDFPEVKRFIGTRVSGSRQGVAAANKSSLNNQSVLMASLAGDGSGSLNKIISDLKEALQIRPQQGLKGLTVSQDGRSVSLRPKSNVRGMIDRATGSVGVRLSRDLQAISHEGGHNLELLYPQAMDAIKQAHAAELVGQADKITAEAAGKAIGKGEYDYGLSPAATMEPDPYHGFRDAVASLPDAVNDQFQVHGIVTGDRAMNLFDLLDNGIDPTRGFNSGPPRAGQFGVNTTRNNAPFLILSEAGKMIPETGIKYVALNGPAEALQSQLQAAYPAVTFMTTAQAVDFMENGTLPPKAPIAPAADLSEGFARWFETYVMDPDTAKKAAPGFNEAFEDMLDGENPAALKALHTAQAEHQSWLARATPEELSSDLVSLHAGNRWADFAKDGTFKNIPGKLATAYTATIDDLNPLNKMVAKLLEVADHNGLKDANGKPISVPVHQNPYKIARMFRGAYSTGYSWLMNGIPNRGEDAVSYNGLSKALETLFGTNKQSQWDKAVYQTAGQYLISKRAVAEYDRLEAKKKRLADIDGLLSQGGEAWRQHTVEEAKSRAMMERRQTAMVRSETLSTDRKRAAARAQAELDRVQERLEAKRDDILAAQMAKADGLVQSRTRQAQALERAQQAAVRDLENIQQQADMLDMDVAVKRAELDQMQQKSDARQETIGRISSAIDGLRKEKARTEKNGASRQPTRESKAWHEELIAKVEADPKTAKIKEFAAQVYEFSHGLLTIRYQAGLIPEDLYQELTKRAGWYVPFQRDMSDATPEAAFFSGGGKSWSPFKKFDGSDRAIINPLEVLSGQAYTTAQHIAFNDATEALASLAERAGPGSANIAEVMTREDSAEANAETFERIKDMAVSLGIDEADAHLIVQQMEQNFGNDQLSMIWSPSTKGPKQLPTIPLWRNGERVMLRLTDAEFGADVFEAMNGLGKEWSDWLVNVIAKPARLLQIGVTTHPTFMPRNLLRDIFDAWIKTGAMPVFTQVKGAKLMFDEDFMARYMAAGGITGGRNVASLTEQEQRSDAFDLTTKQKTKPLSVVLGATAGGVIGTLMAGPVGGMIGTQVSMAAAAAVGATAAGLAVRTGHLLHMVESVETMTRLGVAAHAYDVAKQHDPSLTNEQAMLEAAFVARDLFDWNRRGSKMLNVVRMTTFMNAQIQGLDKAARALGGETSRGSALKKHLGIVFQRESGQQLSAEEERAVGDAYKVFARMALYTLFLLAMYAAYRDDDKYRDIKDKTKWTHSWLPNIYGVDVRLPKAFEWAMPANLIEAIWDKFEGRDPKLAERMREAAWEVMTPPGVPQMLGIYTGIRANKDLGTNREIVGSALTRLDPEAQFDAYTNQVSIDIAKAMAGVGMPRDWVPSPKMIDFIIRTGGYWGQDMARTYQAFRGGVGGHEREEPRYSDMPVLGGFTGVAPRQSKSIEENYKLMAPDSGKLATAAATYADLLKGGQTAEAQTYLARLEPEERAFAVLKQHFSASDNRMHPTERLNDVLKVANNIRKDIILDRLAPMIKQDRHTVYDMENKVTLSPKQQTEVHVMLEKLAQAEAYNTMIAMDRPGWQNAKEMAVKPVLDMLKAGHPKVYEIFEDRMDKAKVQDFADVKRDWPKMKAALLKDGPEASF